MKELKQAFKASTFLILFLTVIAIIRCGRFYDPFGPQTSNEKLDGERIDIPVHFNSGIDGLDLATTLSNVKLTISGCNSGYASSNFTFNGSTVAFYLHDTGCLLSLCSFTYNGENYPNQSPPCGVFNTSVGSLTTFTGSGGANPGGDTVYAYVSQQITGPISLSTVVEFFILQNDSFSNFTLPITNNVLLLSNSNPSSAPYTVADTAASVDFTFKLLYPNPPPVTAQSINYRMVGSAVAGVDYTAPSGTLSIPGNSSSATLTVNLIDNTLARETQDLGVMLDGSSGLQGVTSYYGYGSPTVIITNADTTIAAAGDPGVVFQGKSTTLTSSGGNVTGWTDASSSGFGVAYTATGSPVLNTGANGINSLSTIGFNGSNYLAQSANNTHINSSNSGYTSKVISVVIKTASDVSTRQVIYEQGNATSGVNIYIYNGKIYGSTWASSGSNVNASAYISPSTAYSFTLDFDSTNGYLRIYLSGILVGQTSVSNAIAKATTGVGIGGVVPSGFTKFEDNSTTSSVTGFKGDIAEVLHYSSSNTSYLTDTQIRGIHGYLDAKFNLTSMPAITLSPDLSSVGENDAFLKGFLISRNIPSSSPLTVYYTAGGSAVAGSNYTALPGYIIIPAYATSVYTGLTPINNGTIGDSSTLTLTLKNDEAGGATPITYVGAPNSASLSITDYALPASPIKVVWLNAALGVTTAGGNVSSWVDQTGNAINATSVNNHRPTSVTAAPAYINFNGTSTANAQDFTLATNALLDSASSYTKKTFAVVFRTGSDVTTKQVLYKQGNTTNGMNIVIASGNVYFTGYGSTGWGGANANSISQSVSINTLYAAIFEYDQPNGQMRGKINRVVMTAATTNVGTLTGLATSTAIGGVLVNGLKFYDNTTNTTNNTNYLLGNSRLYELLIWNSILNSSDYSTLESYLLNKYGL